MDALFKIDDYEEPIVKICPNGTLGDVVELGGILIGLPKAPTKGINRIQTAIFIVQFWSIGS